MPYRMLPPLLFSKLTYNTEFSLPKGEHHGSNSKRHTGRPHPLRF